MALKFKVKTREEIPTEQAALYVERDGAFVMDIEGAVDKSKLEEFRAHNIAVNNELKAWKERYEGIDPDEVPSTGSEEGSWVVPARTVNCGPWCRAAPGFRPDTWLRESRPLPRGR